MIAAIAMTFCIEAIPQELRDLPQWVVWKAPLKIPLNPCDGEPASSTDANTWSDFAFALEAWQNHGDTFSGIGFVFTENDPYCGVDLDKCVDENGELFPNAAKIVNGLSSFTEFSPSGKGVHIIVRAKKCGDRCKRSPFAWTQEHKGAIEIYDQARYFTVSGNVVPDTTYTVEDRQAQADKLYRWLFPAPKTPPRASVGTSAFDRCRKYLEKCPESVSGQGGHDKAFRAACECMRFGLSDAESMDMMRWWSSFKSGSEPWNEREIQHKVESARAKISEAGQIGDRLRESQSPSAAKPVALTKSAPVGNGVRDRVERVIDGTWAAAEFPWPMLTSATQALLPGTVTLVCGDPGAGKSFFMLQCVLHWLASGVKFQIFEMEEDTTYHQHRALAMLDGNANLTDLAWIKANPDEARQAEERHRETLGRLQDHIWDAPEIRVTLDDLATWYESVAPDNRIVVIDPVTAAATSDKRFLDDGKFVERCKTIARKTEGSLILVTHPKPGRKRRITLEDIAGGQDYPRFSQCVIVVAKNDPNEEVFCFTAHGRAGYSANRMVQIAKGRNGRGSGSELAFEFSGKDLTFSELGLVIE